MQAYEDVLERYKGAAAGGRPGPGTGWSRGPRQVGGGRGGAHPRRGRAGAAVGRSRLVSRVETSLRALSHLGRRLHSTSYIMSPVIWPPLEGGEARRRFGDETRRGVRGGGGGGGGAGAGEATRSWRGSDLRVPAGVPRPLLSPSASDQSRGSGGCESPWFLGGRGGGAVGEHRAGSVSVQVWWRGRLPPPAPGLPA